MKLLSWNVNSIRSRLPRVLAWLQTWRPEVLCLQELKTSEAQFPFEALRAAGYDALFGHILRANHDMLELAEHLGFVRISRNATDVTVRRPLR